MISLYKSDLPFKGNKDTYILDFKDGRWETITPDELKQLKKILDSMEILKK